MSRNSLDMKFHNFIINKKHVLYGWKSGMIKYHYFLYCSGYFIDITSFPDFYSFLKPLQINLF